MQPLVMKLLSKSPQVLNNTGDFVGANDYSPTFLDLMLVIKPKPSKQLKAWLISVHLFASISLFFMPIWAVLFSIFIILFSFIQSWHSQFIQPKINHFVYYQDQQWFLYPSELAVKLMASTVITPFFILLHFKDKQHKFYSKIICIDSLPNKTWRQLQATLKFQNLID